MREAAVLICSEALSDAAREDALATARRFLDEMFGGWGLQVGPRPPRADGPNSRVANT